MGSIDRNDDDKKKLIQQQRRQQQEYQTDKQQQQQRPFVSAAFSRQEYTNSLVASRDTNISPLEVYETILRLQSNTNNNNTTTSTTANTEKKKHLRALDVGAGAGVSTQVIYQQLGYTTIDAIDWSAEAWNQNVRENDLGYCPSTVTFYELDDERFVEEWKKKNTKTTTNTMKYDIIVFNFAVNYSKALYFCQHLLQAPHGLLLAPINAQPDYWLKQTYQVLDCQGTVLWSAVDVGAWSVQFQPDVTQATCQGIWCMPYNGFQKLQQ